MDFNQWILYIRENETMVAIAAGGVLLFLLLCIWFQVTRTRREVHKICKKIRRYFDVVLTEPEEAPVQEVQAPEKEEDIPVYQMADEQAARQELERQSKQERDAKLLMDVIQEVF